ncbi:MAG: EF-P lysine aminoacylase EpmA [Candidatus Gracilibacteria bacterium]
MTFKMDKQTAKSRSLLTKKIREFFDSHSFLEVETPIMSPCVDTEPNLDPFETFLIDKSGTNLKPGEKLPMYLNPSPELHMKRLLAQNSGELGDIYTLTKVFRNGEFGGGRHNPEFTMLEWYRHNADYTNIMQDCEDLVLYLIDGKTSLSYQNKTIDLSPPWPRISINELFIQNCGIDLLKNRDIETFKKTAEKYNLTGCKTWDDIFYKIFLNDIEPNLGYSKPVIVYDYPATQRALAKKHRPNEFWVERFELYIAGHELCNAFSELTDADEQRLRFEEDLQTRKKMGKTLFPIDEEFLTSLESITQPCAGNALGVDRLMMVLLDKAKIDDVIFFPILTKLQCQ